MYYVGPAEEHDVLILRLAPRVARDAHNNSPTWRGLVPNCELREVAYGKGGVGRWAIDNVTGWRRKGVSIATA